MDCSRERSGGPSLRDARSPEHHGSRRWGDPPARTHHCQAPALRVDEHSHRPRQCGAHRIADRRHGKGDAVGGARGLQGSRLGSLVALQHGALPPDRRLPEELLQSLGLGLEPIRRVPRLLAGIRGGLAPAGREQQPLAYIEPVASHRARSAHDQDNPRPSRDEVRERSPDACELLAAVVQGVYVVVGSDRGRAVRCGCILHPAHDHHSDPVERSAEAPKASAVVRQRADRCVFPLSGADRRRGLERHRAPHDGPHIAVDGPLVLPLHGLRAAHGDERRGRHVCGKRNRARGQGPGAAEAAPGQPPLQVLGPGPLGLHQS
mmetsp:Transcript_35556/g.91431  ORF Transcript_35556/g.91431 Transcript_35556/m.91431 type:complete len:320 (-) Transcript_35556:412-1371(-)